MHTHSLTQRCTKPNTLPPHSAGVQNDRCTLPLLFSLSLSLAFSSPPSTHTHIHSHTSPPAKGLSRYSGICTPNLTHGYFMLWSSIGPHRAVVGRQTKAAQLESHPCCADPQCTVYIGVACVVATRTESSALPCSIPLHYTALHHDYSLGVESWCEEEGVGLRNCYAVVRHK